MTEEHAPEWMVILQDISEEILVKIEFLVSVNAVDTPKTRADYLRLFRSAIELLPAVPSYLDTGKVLNRPRGVKYGE